jgi:hydrogenase-1 operon protein HyaF
MKAEYGKRDNAAPCLSSQSTGMAWSVLTEIHQHLKALAETGETASIALRGLPLTDTDRQQLEDILGKGEVRAELDLAGATEVWETTYAGVWWIRHKGAGDRIACEEIAITAVPEILKTHPVDIKAAARRIRQDLDSGHPPTHERENQRETSNV